MSTARFATSATDRPCWHCTHYSGPTGGGTAALCSRPNTARVRSTPAHGCCCWEREPGADDEPGAPARLVVGDQGARGWRAKDAPPVRVPVLWAP